jgi:regulator of sigma E protease
VVTPQLLPGGAGQHDAYRIGIEIPPDFHTEKLPFTAALRTAAVECKKNSTLIFRLLGQLLSGNGSIKQLGGPVMIAEESGRAAELGFGVLLQFMTLISLNLAIFNLLPIPILDGGLMLMLLIESVMRRDIKQEVKERMYQVAFVCLVLFAAVVIFNDVSKTLHLKQ